jgi:potassium-transporting ATPase KdpC subunit
MNHLVQSLRMLIFMIALTGIAYPLMITGLTKFIFPLKAQGSLIERDGKVVGSRLLAQKFEGAGYFWPRPSAGDYNPLPSGGTNQGQASAALKTQVAERTAKLQAAHPESGQIPQDLLFASGSGLDPHISPDAAYYQMARVAQARKMDLGGLRAIIKKHVEKRQWNVFGEPRVNVLELNLALDRPEGG